MIRRALFTDLQEILDVKDFVIADMAKHNIFQWDHTYPNQAVFTQDIENENLYVIEENGVICGFACIDTNQAPEYDTLDFKVPGTAYVVHRLAIHPEYNGRGYASRIIQFAEALALQNGVFDLRIDTFCENIPAQNFFRKQGFNYIGDVFFPRKKEPFCCFHKTISVQSISA